MIDLLVALSCGLLDRIRGGGLEHLAGNPPDHHMLSLDQRVIDHLFELVIRFLRGRPPFFPTPHILYGLAVAYLTGHGWDGWLTVAIVVGWMLGERPGWGAPIGEYRGIPDPDRVPEWWQVAILRERPLWALIVRGAMWGLPVLVFSWWAGEIVWQPTVAMALAFPLAEVIYKRTLEPLWPREWAGAWNEVYRGSIFGVALWTLGSFS